MHLVVVAAVLGLALTVMLGVEILVSCRENLYSKRKTEHLLMEVILLLHLAHWTIM